MRHGVILPKLSQKLREAKAHPDLHFCANDPRKNQAAEFFDLDLQKTFKMAQANRGISELMKKRGVLSTAGAFPGLFCPRFR